MEICLLTAIDQNHHICLYNYVIQGVDTLTLKNSDEKPVELLSMTTNCFQFGKMRDANTGDL